MAVVGGFRAALQGLPVIFDPSLTVKLHRFSLLGPEEEKAHNGGGTKLPLMFCSCSKKLQSVRLLLKWVWNEAVGAGIPNPDAAKRLSTAINQHQR